MSLFSDIGRRFAELFGGSKLDREHQDEVGFHLEMQAQKYRDSGLSPQEAMRRARLDFGATALSREATREARGVGPLQDLGRDLRHGLRQLRRAPGFTVVATLTLAIGIGAATAIFTVVDRVLLRPVPFADPDQLVVIWETDRASGTTREPASLPDYLDFGTRSKTLAATAGLRASAVSITPEDGDPIRLEGVRVTHGFMPLLGVQPIVGRNFSPEEDQPGGRSVALLSESAWRTQFDSDRSIIGRSVRIDDTPTEIIGVVPDAADFGLDQIHDLAAYHAPYNAGASIDVWLPLASDENSLPRSTHPLLVLGRLAPSATVATAHEELVSIMADLERAYPVNADRGAFVESFDDVVFGNSRPLLYLLMASVTLFLLVACVNVANLLLARSTTRAREVAVRGALGASTSRITRQFMAESMLLVLMGATAGIGLAYVGLKLLLANAPADVPRLSEAGLDSRAIVASLVLTLLVSFAFGMVPALQALRVDVMSVLRGESGSSQARSRRRVRQGLVIAELAMSVALAVCAGLVVRSFSAVLNVDAGFDATGVVKAQYQLPSSRYPTDYRKFPNFTEIQQFNARLVQAASQIPGVTSAALAGSHPLDAGFTNSWVVLGRESEAANWPEISTRAVTPGYFQTMGVRLLRGRLLEESDDASAAPVAVINETVARRFFATQDPLGQQLNFWGIPRRIVGVISDERIHGLTSETPPATYAPLAQVPQRSGVLLVKTQGDPLALAEPVRQAIRSVDSQLAVFGVEPFSATVMTSVGQRRFAVLVLGVFSAVTIVLALIGIHGVVSYLAAQRTREISIRLALGATRNSVLALVLRGALGLAGIGIVLGLAGAMAGSRLLSGLLFGISRLDPVTFVLVPLVVVLATLIATWVPAYRAARSAPVSTLRSL